MLKDFAATIAESSARAADWIKVFGSREVVLKHPGRDRAEFPDGIHPFYELDMDALTSEQRAHLIAHLSGRFQLPYEEVENELDTVGCPIFAEDVIVTIKNPGRWL